MTRSRRSLLFSFLSFPRVVVVVSLVLDVFARVSLLAAVVYVVYVVAAQARQIRLIQLDRLRANAFLRVFIHDLPVKFRVR